MHGKRLTPQAGQGMPGHAPQEQELKGAQDRTKGSWEARPVPQHRRGHLQARRRQEAALHPAGEGLDAQLSHERVDIGILAPEPASPLTLPSIVENWLLLIFFFFG